MEIREENKENFVVLGPIGDLDANSSIQMDEKVREWLAKGKTNFHIDCSSLEYISSAGLGLFISFLEEVRSQSGDFIFSGMSPKIYKVFELLGLHNIVKIYPNAVDAEKEFVI